jgi:hypothetical protein
MPLAEDERPEYRARITVDEDVRAAATALETSTFHMRIGMT